MPTDKAPAPGLCESKPIPGMYRYNSPNYTSYAEKLPRPPCLDEALPEHPTFLSARRIIPAVFASYRDAVSQE